MGYNLLDYVKKDSGEAIYTVLIPLGARLDESEVEGLDAYTNIKSVNDGKDYIYNEEAIKKFGLVWTTQKWDDVTVPENLLRKGKQWLEANQYESITLELTAIDMSMLNQNIDTFDLGDTIRVIAKPFGLDATYPVRKKTTYLQEPEKNTIVLSSTELSKSYTKKVEASISDLTKELPQEKSILQKAKENASMLIKTATEGNIYMVDDENGNPKELLIMDQPDIDTAKKVWRWNMNGFGYSSTGYNGTFGTAITMDGGIVGDYIVAGSISAEKLNVEYKKTLSQEITTTAQNAADSAQDSANEYTDSQLKNYYTTTTIDTKFTATDGNISAEVTRATQAENSISGSLDSYKEEVTSKFSVTDGNISAEVARAKSEESALKSSIQVNADNITSKVSKGDFGSYMQQNYNYFLLGFNGNSHYIQINPGEIAIYNNGVENSKKRATFDQNGNHFYRDGYTVGCIGTNQWANDNSHKGLTFDLEYQGKYMAFAQAPSASSTSYTSMLCFSRANSIYDEYGIHARYGRDVRKSIHDSIEKCYGHFEEVTASCTASENNARDYATTANEAKSDTLRYSESASRDASTATQNAQNVKDYAANAYQYQQNTQSMKEAVEKDKNDIETTIKNSLLAKSEEILATVKDYFDRAQQLYNSMYIDCDGETPQSRLVTLVTIDCGTPQSRLFDTNGILFDGGTPLNRKLGG